MSTPIRFDEKVAIVTGAGAGLGKTYALFLASRGAKVVVNDLGASPTGDGTSGKAADEVVNEIRKNGGTAVANYDSVEFGDKIVKTALDNFGRIDIIVNNAGFVRDKSFGKMTQDDWEKVMKVHLYGHFSVIHAAWNKMREQKYGRIINVGSSSGIFGNFGQANYSSAKLGIHGLTQSLAKEGGHTNIKVNTICPVAGTRMTEGVLTAEYQTFLRPEYICPLVGVLAHETCPESGALFELGGGWIAKLRWQRSFGLFLDVPCTPEEVLARWNEVTDFSKGEYPTGGNDTFPKILANLERMKKEGKYPPPAQPVAAAKPAPAQAKAAEAAPAGPSKTPCADRNFAIMAEFMRRGEGKDIVKKLQAIYNFEIVEKFKTPPLKTWILDMKNGDGKVYVGKHDNADATFTMTDKDFDDVCFGRVHPQQSFATGKMRIRGGMKKASAFTPELFPPPTPENVEKYRPPKL